VWVAPQDHRVVGECLAAARSRAGVTQRKLASRLDKPQSFISAYENGQRRIDILEFLRIVMALGVDPRTVFGEVADRAIETNAGMWSNNATGSSA
jgi:transcriptional regulator with XRE-family HTH domain